MCTGGLGGAFGYFYGVGNPLPIPECQPYRKSWQFSLLGNPNLNLNPNSSPVPIPNPNPNPDLGKVGELGKLLKRFRK